MNRESDLVANVITNDINTLIKDLNKVIIVHNKFVDRFDKVIEYEEEIMYLANKTAITTQNIEVKAIRDRLEEIFEILKGEE